jgi:hypothetical protein
MTDTFDDATIGATGREPPESPGAHPLAQHLLYGMPCPPQPDLGPVDSKDEEQVAEAKELLTRSVDWLLVNYAYHAGASKGRSVSVISLVDGTTRTLANLSAFMAPWMLLEIGRNGGNNVRSPVKTWLRSTARISVSGEVTHADKTWPIFVEEGHTIYNHYRPPASPAGGGEGEDEDEGEAAGRHCAGPERRFLPGPAAPLELAKQLYADTYALPDGNRSLYHWRGSWWRWETTRWCEVEETEMRAQIYRYTENAVFFGEGVEDWNPNDRRVSDVLDAHLWVQGRSPWSNFLRVPMTDNSRHTGAAIEAHYRFVVWLVPTIEKFPKSHKFTIGDRIELAALDVLDALIEVAYRAGSTCNALGRRRWRISQSSPCSIASPSPMNRCAIPSLKASP